MVLVFTDTLLNILSKHIISKIITCNDKDSPWITSKVKTVIRRNSRVYRKWLKRGRNPTGHYHVREVQNATNKLIRDAEWCFYEKLVDKLSDPETGQKDFWTAFKRISNKKKLTNIPPIFENNRYIPNFQQKADIFDIYDNGSVLPVPFPELMHPYLMSM